MSFHSIISPENFYYKPRIKFLGTRKTYIFLNDKPVLSKPHLFMPKTYQRSPKFTLTSSDCSLERLTFENFDWHTWKSCSLRNIYFVRSDSGIYLGLWSLDTPKDGNGIFPIIQVVLSFRFVYWNIYFLVSFPSNSDRLT